MIASLLTEATQAVIPIVPVSESQCETSLHEHPPHVRNWAKANGFSAKPGSICMVPNQDGQIDMVLFGVADTTDIWTFAGLPMNLPAGVYRFQATESQTLNWQDATLGWALGSYQFTRYRKAERAPAQLLVNPRANLAEVQALATGLCLTRDLVNTPAQDMMPQHLAAATADLAQRFGAKFSEIVGADLLKQNYPVIHAVGRASVHAPRLLDLRWGQAEHPKLTLVGKGVCFDSGGLDLKPSSGMRYMKKDMGGAAHVLGLASMIMQAKLPVCLRVLIPAVENAVSGDAFRPGDVLTSRSGKTIEIDNTDAEGRLVLCDALAEAVTENPDLLIDMATLTGAARVALGPDVAAIFAQHAVTANMLQTLANDHTDPLWVMPLYQPYKRWLKSEIADLANSSSVPYGGAITAALFLQAFVPEKLDWVHMDVMAWNIENLPGRPKGGEAMGLRAFFSYLQHRYENPSVDRQAPSHASG